MLEWVSTLTVRVVQLVDQKKWKNIKNRRVAEATGLTLPSKAYYIWLMLLIDGFI